MNLPIGQFYDVSYDFAVPYNICSGAQDNGAWCGPSRRRNDAGEQHPLVHDLRRRRLLHRAGSDGPEHGVGRDRRTPAFSRRTSRPASAAASTSRRGTSAIASGKIRSRSSAAIRSSRRRREQQTRIDALRAQQKKDSADLQIRYNWESPYFLSPHNPQVFYLGGSRVLKSTKRGEDLYPISPDLSVKTDPAQERARLARIDTVEKYTGGITLDLTGAEAYGTVVALQESPIKPGFLLAGTDDGNVWITHNDGGDVGESHAEVRAARRAVGRVRRAPRAEPLRYAHVLRGVRESSLERLHAVSVRDERRRQDVQVDREQPAEVEPGGLSARDSRGSAQSRPAVRRQLAHRRTCRSIAARRGRKFATNLPTVPVFDLQIHPRDHELIAATHGRSLWIVDIAALEQMTPKVVAQGTYLFTPKTAYQWGEGPQLGLPGNGYGQAVMTYANPPYGADIVYRLALGGVGHGAADREQRRPATR